MPERIWADRSDDGLPAYADTPFGIWWCASREGYSEFVRADLFAATLARAERAEAALAEAVEAAQRVTITDAKPEYKGRYADLRRDIANLRAILAAIPASAPWTPPDGFCECLGWVRGEWLHVVRMGRDKPWQWVSEEGDTVSPTAFAPLPPAPDAAP